MTRIPIKLPGASYEAWIQSGLLSRAGEIIHGTLNGPRRCFVVTVPAVARLWGKMLKQSLSAAKHEMEWLMMPDGERHKRLSTVETMAERMVERRADRDSVVIAFGGGVSGDVAGLLASVYMRGVPFVQIPTTVLAQVDASIGGKTGVNLREGKNLLGTFHQPRAVLIDPGVLKTLPAREFRAGLYESLKCGVIGNAGLFRLMEEHPAQLLARESWLLERVIGASVRLKAAVVSQDERESGLRRILNFGHTVGHALEAETNYRHFLHGEAVAWGMIAATKIAESTGKLSAEDANKIEHATLAFGRLPKVSVKPRNILKRLQSDKKTRNGQVHFVLPVVLGRVEVSADVHAETVLEALRHIEQLSNRSGKGGRAKGA
jgi:3-dehydroquinate synthase